MGYNPSKQSVEGMKVVLDYMVEHMNDDFKYPTSVPDKLAYAIRRAMHGIKAFLSLSRNTKCCLTDSL
jgi:hypothetical protein